MIGKKGKGVMAILLCGCLLGNLAGCGTILYPERRGQQTGRIDVGVALLDGIGLLFFVIPGIFAYAVDFSTGAIYLPPGAASGRSVGEEPLVVKVEPSSLNSARLAAIVKEHTGVAVQPENDYLVFLQPGEREQVLAALRMGDFRRPEQ